MINERWLPVTHRDMTQENEIYRYPDDTAIYAMPIDDWPGMNGRKIGYKVGDRKIGTGWVNDKDIQYSDELKFGPFHFVSTAWERIVLFTSPQSAAAWLTSRGLGPATVKGFSAST